MARALRILIVGAGIAGLSLARALRQRGLATEIVERADAWDHAGSGLFIPANGVRALRHLGLDEPVRSRACVIPRQRVLDHRGRLLFDVDLGEVWAGTGACLAIHRQRLHEILRQSIDAPVRLGTTVASVSEHTGGVHVELSDGSSGDYDVLVGADGINSSIRRMSFGDASPRYVGQASWRMVVERGPPISTWTVMLGSGRAFLVIPLGEDGLYCYADLNSPSASDPTESAQARFVELFREFGEPVPAILSRLSPAQPPYFSPIEEVIARSWVKSRVVLMGDAAHATSPNMAQGASMAMEDALVLAEILSTGQSVDACLAAFQERRRPRVQWVQAQTHRRDRTRNLPPAIRNWVLRVAGKRIMAAGNRPLIEDP